MSSIDASTGRWGQVAYGVSKAGVNALTQYVATTHGREHIRCNAVAPGLDHVTGRRSGVLPA